MFPSAAIWVQQRRQGVTVIDLVVRSREQGDWTVVEVEGEVDIFTAPKLREHIIHLIEQGKHRLVVDLGGVSFMDSTGLGTLVGSLKRVKEHEGELALASMHRSVQRVLAITGLDKVFPCFETLDAALAPR